MNLLKSSFLLLIILLSSSCAIQSSDKATSQEVKNITAFSKIYGYVKYFHPSDEAREIDWNRLAVLGVKRVKEAQTREELKNALEKLFLPIAPTITFSEAVPDSNAFLSRYVEHIGADTTDLKTVAWQHLGLDMSHKNQAYASSRTNRKDKVPDRHFILYQNINAQDLTGATVRLRAMIKATFKNQSSEGELTLRMDDGNSQALQTVNETIRSTSSDEWKEYTVQAELDPSASQITLGATLKGEGKFWVDNIQLETKDKEGHWTAVPLENSTFEDHYKDWPDGWKANATGNYDYALVSDNAVNGKSFYIASKDLLFQRYPKVGETAVRPLAKGLWSEIPLALYSDEDHTLPRSSQTEFNRLKKELETIDLTGATGNSEHVRLADIVVAWNVLQHFYPYFDVIDTDWETQLSLSLEKALGDDTQQEFNATLSRMLASTRDGHIRLRHPSISNEAGLPFLLDWIENKVVVTHSLHKEIQPGDIIKSLDGKPATKIVQDQQNYLSGSPQLLLFRSLRQFGAGKSGTETTVQVQREETIKSYTVPRSSRHSNNKIEKNHLPITGQIEDGIYYVDLSRASMERINDEMNQIASSPGVIFDLRGYPNSNHEVIRHLLIRPDTSDQWLQIPKIIYPDQQNIVGYQKSGWHLTPAKPHIQGDVVFLTDARAISYAESFMSFIEHYDLGEIVGQPTAGTNGNVNRTELPGGYQFGWTGMKVVKHNGSQHHLIGIQPTIPVKKTIQGVREGKDEILEKAIGVLK